MKSRVLVSLALLTTLALPSEARAQALSDSVVSVTNATVSSVSFSLGSADAETQKIDGSLKSRETKAYKIWTNTRLRIAVTSGGFRIIRYFEVLPGERYRIGVDAEHLYDLRQLHPRDEGETKLTPVKEEKIVVPPKSPKTMRNVIGD
jgi:hypothetical protein